MKPPTLRSLLPLLAFTCALAAYSSTLAPSVTGEDSGELAAAAATLGVAHPPGYPTWTLLAHAFLQLGSGDVAWRLNLLSALCAALAVGGVCALILRLGARPAVALGGTLLLGAGPAMWSQAVITEVYALNVAFVALFLWLGLRWRDDRDDRLLLPMALLAGLALGNHHTFVLLLPPACWFLLLERGLKATLRRLPVLASGLMAGLAVYLYLPLASMGNPPLDWGDPEGWRNFLDHVARQQYPSEWTRGVSVEWGLAWEALLLREVWQQLPLPGLALPLALLGVPMLIQRLGRGIRWPLLLLVLLTGPALAVMVGYPLDPDYISAFRVFFLPLHLVVAVLIACGAEAALRRLEQGPRQSLVRAISLAAGMTVIALWGATTAERESMAGNHSARVHAENILHSVDRDAIVFAEADHEAFPLLYLQAVEGVRPDVLVCDYVGDFEAQVAGRGYNASAVDRPVTEKAWARFLARADRPVYFTRKRQVAVPGAVFVAVGPLFRWLPDASSTLVLTRSPKLVTRRLQPLPTGSWLAWDRTTRSLHSTADQFTGLELFRRGRREGALQAFRSARSFADESKQSMNNLGSLLAEVGEEPYSLACYRAALALDPSYRQAASNVRQLELGMGEHFRSAWDLAEGLELYPEDSVLRHNLGTWFAGRGRWRQASGEYRHALALRPDYELAKRHLASLPLSD